VIDWGIPIASLRGLELWLESKLNSDDVKNRNTYFLSDDRKPQLSENPKSRASQLSEIYLTCGSDGCVSRLQRWDSRLRYCEGGVSRLQRWHCLLEGAVVFLPALFVCFFPQLICEVMGSHKAKQINEVPRIFPDIISSKILQGNE
jgi:hypothetical protein